MTVIGLISDTHGLLRPEACAALQGCARIVHAGDIGKREVIDALAAIAPVSAIRGNVDKGDWALEFAQDEVVKVGDRHLYVLHNLHDLDLDPVAAGFDVVICGHSHQPRIEEIDGVLYVNPGSAGPRRFSLPVTVARLSIGDVAISAEVIEIIA